MEASEAEGWYWAVPVRLRLAERLGHGGSSRMRLNWWGWVVRRRVGRVVVIWPGRGWDFGGRWGVVFVVVVAVGLGGGLGDRLGLGVVGSGTGIGGCDFGSEGSGFSSGGMFVATAGVGEGARGLCVL